MQERPIGDELISGAWFHEAHPAGPWVSGAPGAARPWSRAGSEAPEDLVWWVVGLEGLEGSYVLP